MILAVDVAYRDGGAVAAGAVFLCWTDDAVTASHVSSIAQVSDYTPGQFYRRELPCILKLLDEHSLSPDTVVIDGYVYLDGCCRPGLGRYLYDALQHRVRIIGVAKKPFSGISDEYAVYRGSSRQPLYVTCAGLQLDEARKRVASMHGDHRIPTMLKIVDQLARQSLRIAADTKGPKASTDRV